MDYTSARGKKAADIAKNLNILLQQTGLSQADVSRASGIPRDAFGRYLHGVNLPPARKIARIAAALGCSPHQIDPSLPADLKLLDSPDTSSRILSIGRGLREGHMRITMDAELPGDLIISIARLITEHGGQGPQVGMDQTSSTNMEP